MERTKRDLTPIVLGYNTNGLAHHSLVDAIDLVADIGYRAIAITLDHDALNPFDDNLDEHIAACSAQLERRSLVPVVETGARYLLDPRRKHWPTLVSARGEDRERRFDFLRRSIGIAQRIKSRTVSLWSGAADDGADRAACIQRLVDELPPLLDLAADHDIDLAFEPEPGMAIASLADYGDLLEALTAAKVDIELFKLTLDTVHLHCQDEGPIADRIRAWSSLIANVHLADAPRDEHDHRMFGDGSIDFEPVLAALRELSNVPICVELSRHSHIGPIVAQQAFDFLNT